MTERFDHVYRAIELGDMATDSWNAGRPEAARAQMEGAQVHATLALVEQQRIANLIALWTVSETDALQLVGTGVDFGEILTEVREGLGL